ncbi:MAG: hypothetical protein HY340_02025 [Candidatus Kerfeldbacteria bacterium]|nr:hypothetical protein [Candidatus Kerfeldbacteria bacterium]
MRWFRFFLGTPQRLLSTVVAVVILYALVNPGNVAGAVNRAFGALFGPLATIAILVLVLRMIFGRRR